MTVIVSSDSNETVKSLCLRLLEAIESLASTREFITIGLSGGSLIKQLSTELPKYKTKLTQYIPKLRFLFCDERYVPLNHDDSTYYGFMNQKFFEQFSIPSENVYPIKADEKTVEECAKEYEQRLRPLLNKNDGFDILLLGIGPDGHTCSLFPDHKSFQDSLNTTQLVIPVKNSPKPPPQRVTLTLNYINNSDYLFFCAVGENKADVLKRILRDDDLTLPSANVKPNRENGTLIWFLDQPAAKLL